MSDPAARIEALERQNAALLAACRLMDPRGICTANRNIPDSMVVSLDIPMGELRQFRAAIARATQSPAPTQGANTRDR